MDNEVKNKELLALASDTGFSAALFSAVANDHPGVGDILRAAGASLSDKALQIASRKQTMASRQTGHNGQFIFVDDLATDISHALLQVEELPNSF